MAIATGAPGPDVLDIDRHGEASGFPALRQLKEAGLVGEPQAMVRTPSGGAHLYFARDRASTQRPHRRRAR